MPRFSLVVMVLLALVPPALARDFSDHPPVSAFRRTGESFREARLRGMRAQETRSDTRSGTRGDARSAWDSQRSLQGLDWNSIPELGDTVALLKAFRLARDSRLWTWESMPEFPRRLPWLYPSDGCFLRAELLARKFVEWGFPKPRKLFAFGDLSYSLPYESGNWWYHVAPVVRAHGTPYVIDPAMDFNQPLPLSDWIARMIPSADEAGFALCGAGTLSPDDDCGREESDWDPMDLDSTLQSYLGLEWANLESILGASPREVLGDHPPWN